MKVTIKAPAKINLFLEVTGKRADGFHELDMLMQKLQLADLLTLEKISQPKGQPGLLLSSSDKRIPTDERNLVWQAWQLLAQDFPEKFSQPCKIHLEKKIPQQAGLGGGSSDAASAIMGLNRLYDLALSRQDMCHYGQQLGSDVNFFFYGPSCRVRGRGEIIQEIPPLPALPLVLLKPKKGLSAGKVYSRLDLSKIVDRGIKSFKEPSSLEDLVLFNRLEEPAFKLYPALEKMKNQLLAQNPRSLMTGSGTTFFSLFEKKEESEIFYQAMKETCYFSALTSFAQDCLYKEDAQ